MAEDNLYNGVIYIDVRITYFALIIDSVRSDSIWLVHSIKDNDAADFHVYTPNSHAILSHPWTQCTM